MKKTTRSSFGVVILLMITLTIAAFVWSRLEAGAGCKHCPQPPEGCSFTGCDASGNCTYQC